jgi:uncharacterized membrane protein YoaK (UPF0700 family)
MPLHSPGRDAFRDLLLLSFTAGGADAAGYLGPGRVFTSNMTGNVVLFGIGLGQRHFREAAHTGYVLVIFLLGALAGAWMSQRIRERTWGYLAVRVIGLEAVLLGLFALLWYLFSVENRVHQAFYPLITLLALAMGLQAAAMNRLSVPGVVTTAITGTLTSLARGLVKMLDPTGDVPASEKRPAANAGFQALAVGAYAAGAVLSGFLMLHGRAWVGFVPVPILLFIVAGQARALRRAR